MKIEFRSIESRVESVGGTIQSLLEAARATLAQAAQLDREIAEEVVRLEQARDELNASTRLAAKLVELSE